MFINARKACGVLILVGVLVPVILTAVPSAQAATVCDAVHPCLPQNIGFTSGIVNGDSAAFQCSNVTAVSYCLLGQSTNGTTSGVSGISGLGPGVYGTTAASGVTTGAVVGSNSNVSLDAVGVKGVVSQGYGGHFTAPGSAGIGVYGNGGSYGVIGSSATSTGVRGGGGTYGVDGFAFPGEGHAGVHGTILSNAANAAGVSGVNFDNGFAVSGFSPNNWSGYFQGSVNVVGTLYKSSGAFRIDNPIDPVHSYLQHSFVESPDMKNVYDGVVRTNGKGFATVKLPAWFQALNKDFRYQLTVIAKPGQFVQAMVVKELANNRFTLQTSKPNVKVSWQVTGIRHDAYANAHRIQTVVPKTGSADGKYVHPELYGKPTSKSVVVLPGMTAGTQPDFKTPTLARKR